MAKQVEIYLGTLKLGYANKAEVKPETQTSDVATFDGVITDGEKNISWTISIDQVRYGKVKDYITIQKKLHKMFTVPDSVKIVETSQTVDGTIKVTDQVYNCLVDDKNYSIDPESRTIESLSFKGGKLKKWINGEEIPF